MSNWVDLSTLVAEHRWECPNCDQKDVTRESRPHTRFHPCRGLAGITAPMVPAGTKCKVEAKEREDYVGDQDVQLDGNGRPIMAVVTTREDGQDCAVLAPVAHKFIASNQPGNNKSGRSVSVGPYTAEMRGEV